MKVILHQRLHCEQHVAVCIVKQVERRQNNQRVAGLKISSSHRSSEYSMPSNQITRARFSQDCSPGFANQGGTLGKRHTREFPPGKSCVKNSSSRSAYPPTS